MIARHLLYAACEAVIISANSFKSLVRECLPVWPKDPPSLEEHFPRPTSCPALRDVILGRPRLDGGKLEYG